MSRINAMGQAYIDRANADPEFYHRSVQKSFGMSPADLEMSLKAASALARGQMPDASVTKWLNAQAKQSYSWGPSEVKAALNSILTLSSPDDRVAAYLRAGNGRDLPPEVLSSVTEMVQTYMHAETSTELTNRLNEGRPDLALRDNFDGMKATARSLEAATDRASIRDAIATQMKMPNREMSFEEKRAATELAREELANRIDAGVTKVGKNSHTNMRDALRDAYDLSALKSASAETGLSNFVEETKNASDDWAHLNPGFDVTANLSGDLDGGLK